ncbi:MAG: hypothetical protein ACAI35_18800, partial [Candidatus Methylacidiphilales bacterium]
NPGSLLGDSSVALSVMHYSNALPQSRLALIPKSIPVFVPINVCEWSYSFLQDVFDFIRIKEKSRKQRK